MKKKVLRVFRRLWHRHAGLVVAVIGASLLGWSLTAGWGRGLPTSGDWSSLLSGWGVFFLPFVLAGLAIDLGRWRMRVQQNRERQRIFQFLNAERIDVQTRLLQELLTLREMLLQRGHFDSPVTSKLDTLIVDQHRHLSSLRQRASDSDLMAPLLTAAYAQDFGKTTWTATLEGEFHKRRSDW